jgi:uncharacterized protein (DUF2062 family)
MLGGMKMSTLMLVCAVLASLAFGVLVAYGICQWLFRIFSLHAQSAARQREQSSVARVVVQG